MLVNKFTLTLAFIFLCFFSFSQEEEETEKWKFKENVSIDGYIKYLPSVSFAGVNNIYTNNLIHNRINTKAYLGDYFTAKIAFRNRLFYGEQVKITPNFGKNIAVDNGEMDLSFLWIDEKAIVLHTIIDRAFLDFANDKWQVTLGRQRVNWGINLAWNSNDLFNAYNIVDFDYEEKAGTDALRIQYVLDSSSIEIAYKPGKDLDNTILATRYTFNKWKYDFQFLAANYNQDIALGTGWAGNIKKAGFKGEATFFQNKDSSDNSISTSISMDYFFKKGLYLNASFLYSSLGENKFNPSVLGFTSSNLSAKNLMPSKYSGLIQVSQEFNPRIKGSFTTIYGYGMDILFLMPSLDYSIADNWDLNLTGQVFFGKPNNNFQNLGNSVYFRLRYSY